MVLSQGQFFDPSEYNVDPDKMNFNQFYKSADAYHGRYSSDPDYYPSGSDPHYGAGSPFNPENMDPTGHRFANADERTEPMHLGTEQAALQRIEGKSGGVGRYSGTVYPFRRIAAHPDMTKVIDDKGVDWGPYETTAKEKNVSVPYINAIEDPGSISTVSPGPSVQTYKEYVGSQAHPTERQQLETGRRSVEGVAVGKADDRSFVQRQMDLPGMAHTVDWSASNTKAQALKAERQRKVAEARPKYPRP